MPLDYEQDVKQFAIALLAGDLFGKGRVEAAIFKTFQHVYGKGYEEGFTMGLAKNDARVEALERKVEVLQSLLTVAKGDYCHVRFTDRGGMCERITEVLKEKSS
jgi:hypothetical protein